MKKICVLFVVLTMMFIFVSCVNGDNQSQSSSLSSVIQTQSSTSQSTSFSQQSAESDQSTTGPPLDSTAPTVPKDLKALLLSYTCWVEVLGNRTEPDLHYFKNDGTMTVWGFGPLYPQNCLWRVENDILIITHTVKNTVRKYTVKTNKENGKTILILTCIQHNDNIIESYYPAKWRGESGEFYQQPM